MTGTVVSRGSFLLPIDRWNHCRYCGKPTPNSLSRRKHERDVHEGADPRRKPR